MIAVAEDARGLAAAAAELLEESFAAQREKNRAKEILEELAAKRRLPVGYYARVFALQELEEQLECGLNLSALPADIGEGLAALRRARAAFERQHPPCPQCGAPLEHSSAHHCWSCLSPIRKEQRHA